MDAEWRDVPGYEGYYQVTAHGAIRRIAPGKSFPHVNIDNPRMLTPWLNTSGYPAVALFNDAGQRKFPVHKVVALAFIGPKPSPSHEVAHLNGDRTDARAENLAWVTSRENTSHSRMHGTMHHKFSAAQVEEVKRLRHSGMLFREIGEALGMSPAHACAIFNGKRGHIEMGGSGGKSTWKSRPQRPLSEGAKEFLASEAFARMNESPKARRDAALTMRDHGMTVCQIGAAIGRSAIRASQLVKQAAREREAARKLGGE